MSDQFLSGFVIKHPYVGLEHNQEIYREYYVVNWTFYNVCNYSCSYCVPGLYDGSQKGPSLEEAIAFIDRVFEAKPDKKIFFEFTGGEITFYKHFRELFTHIKNRGGATGIISNGSQRLEWWKKHAHLIDHACLSFHAERGKPEHFFDVVAALNPQMSLHINIMMLPEKFDELLELGKKIASKMQGTSVALQPLFERFSGPMFHYTEEQLRVIENPQLPFESEVVFRKTDGFQKKIFRGDMRKVYADGRTEMVDPTLLISNRENSWLGWECWIGVENLVVTAEGQVIRGVCGQGGLIGNIRDSHLQLPESPVKCLKKRCTCAFDIMSSKRLSAQD
jgi:organic radical activating enzyme